MRWQLLGHVPVACSHAPPQNALKFDDAIKAGFIEIQEKHPKNKWLHELHEMFPNVSHIIDMQKTVSRGLLNATKEYKMKLLTMAAEEATSAAAAAADDALMPDAAAEASPAPPAEASPAAAKASAASTGTPVSAVFRQRRGACQAVFEPPCCCCCRC